MYLVEYDPPFISEGFYISRNFFMIFSILFYFNGFGLWSQVSSVFYFIVLNMIIVLWVPILFKC